MRSRSIRSRSCGSPRARAAWNGTIARRRRAGGRPRGKCNVRGKLNGPGNGGTEMTERNDLEATIKKIVDAHKGILAADESTPTITKRFTAVGIESTEDSRRAYRSLLITTPGAADYLSGVILYEETLGQKASDGTPLPQVL